MKLNQNIIIIYIELIMNLISGKSGKKVNQIKKKINTY